MANFLYYRGFPLIRSGNTIFYGSAGDAFAAKLTVKETKRIGDEDVPNKIMVQLMPKSPADFGKSRKGEYTGFYEALDAAHVWLTDVLFN